MATVLQLKKDIRLNAELASLLSVIEDIAVSQFHSLDKKKQRFDALMQVFQGFFSMIDFYQLEHPLARSQNEDMAIIIISSDEGFMGGLNNKVINAALTERAGGKGELLIIGTRGAEHLKGMGEKFTAFPGIDLSNRQKQAEHIKDYIMKGVKENRFGHCILSYAKSVSFSVQRIEIETLLPCSRVYNKVGVDEKGAAQEQKHPGPVRGKSPEAAVAPLVRTSNGARGLKGLLAEHEGILIESSLDELLEYLMGLYIVEKLFLVFEENKLSEFGARANHLEGSCQYLRGEGKKIRLQYLKLAHAIVDRGMRETFSSQILKKGKKK